MRRLPAILVLSLVTAPGLATAATVSTFSVEAFSQMQLTGATFASGGDASGSLAISYVLDQLDDFPQKSGRASVGTLFTNDDIAGSVEALADGNARGPFGSASADVSGRLVQTITNSSAAAITLAFDYSMFFQGSVSGPDAEVYAATFVELQDFFGQVFYQEIPLFSTPPQSLAGRTALTFGAGETVYAAAYTEIFGSASVFVAPVPLPATLPLLAVAVAVGGLWGWRVAGG